jgi:hypothetical protein
LENFRNQLFQASTNPMKRMLLAVFSAFCLHASAQITLTNAVFPAVGDTLKFATDNSPAASINPATPPGGPQTWDFSTLEASQTAINVYQAASAGMNAGAFPGADLVLIGTTGETYFNVTNSKVEAMGYSGDDPANFGIDVTVKFAPPLVERRAPTNFFDISSSNSSLGITLPTDVPPLNAIFGNLPVNIDSLRVRVITDRLEVVDGFGNCLIPGGQYPVLRQKRTEYRTTAMDVYVNLGFFGNWVDLSTLIGGSGGPGGLGDFIGTDTTITYRFLSGTEKEEIAVATMTNDLSEVNSVRFKNIGLSDAEDLVDAPGTAGIHAYPNPAVEWVRFDCTNLPNDAYTLKIFNLVGKVVWKENYQLAGNRSIRLELEPFRKGTYLYSLSDSKGNIIGTKRLVILKP